MSNQATKQQPQRCSWKAIRVLHFAKKDYGSYLRFEPNRRGLNYEDWGVRIRTGASRSHTCLRDHLVAYSRGEVSETEIQKSRIENKNILWVEASMRPLVVWFEHSMEIGKSDECTLRGTYPTVCTLPSSSDRARYEREDPLAITFGCTPSRTSPLTPWTKPRAPSYETAESC